MSCARAPERLLTPRAILSRPQLAELPEYSRLYADPRVAEHIPAGVRSESQARDHLVRRMEQWEREGFGFYTCRLRSTGEFAGAAGLTEREDGGPPQLTYTLLPHVWGQGLATELGRALVAQALFTLELPVLRAVVLEGNRASARVLEKLGFRPSSLQVSSDGRTAHHLVLDRATTPARPVDADPLRLTQRLVLHPMHPQDVDALLPWYQDPELMRYITPGGRSEPLARKGLLNLLEQAQRLGFGNFLLRLRADGSLIGNAMLIERTPGAMLEIGYLLIASAWGQRYASEAAAALLDLAFGALSQPRIAAVVEAGNVASVRLLEKLGLREVSRGVKGNEQLARFEIGRADWRRG